MTGYRSEYCYMPSGDAQLYTAVLLPGAGQYPTVIVRTPYVDVLENVDPADVAAQHMNDYRAYLRRGYAVVLQHCRGRGLSSGDCIPYINERQDGLALQAWIRLQPFYNGELYLRGNSYLCTVHFVTAPFADDIRGAVLSVQDQERYNVIYRNGFFKQGLHGDWYVKQYKYKTIRNKAYTVRAFDMLPLTDFPKTVFGEEPSDLVQCLRSPRRTDPFWQTHEGGTDARGAIDHASIPILMTTGFYDIYTGGIFDQWFGMDETARGMSALVVSPYDHGDRINAQEGIAFPNGQRAEQFGAEYEIDWFDAIRHPDRKMPFEQGKITYYRLFENSWAADAFDPGRRNVTLTLGDRDVSYVYNPYDPPFFKGGLSCNFGGSCYQDAPNSRHDIVSVYTEPFAEDAFVKGKMSAQLTVSSDCEDTCFYVRVSIAEERGDYGLRDDITSLCYQLGDYVPGTDVQLDFNFDEHAFLIRRGQRLRVDIASADNAHYVRHTNMKGLYCEQTTARVAHNTVRLAKSTLTLPVEDTSDE